MTKVIYVFAILLTACGGHNIPEGIKYDIIKEVPHEVLGKDNIDVRLNTKVSQADLKEIALALREDRKQYEKLWICYYLPGMKVGSGAWAITHFTPELEVKIFGSTLAEDRETASTVNIDGDIVGKWRSETSLSGAALIVYSNSNGKLMLKTTFKDGSSRTEEVRESKEGSRIRYDDGNLNGEYFVVENNGNLGIYGDNGKFEEAVIIP